MSTQHFNAPDELRQTQQKRKLRRKKKYRKSCLEQYRAEIVAMLQDKAGSYRLVAEWLAERKIEVSHTTVMRYAKKLPEMAKTEVPHAELP